MTYHVIFLLKLLKHRMSKQLCWTIVMHNLQVSWVQTLLSIKFALWISTPNPFPRGQSHDFTVFNSHENYETTQLKYPQIKITLPSSHSRQTIWAHRWLRPAMIYWSKFVLEWRDVTGLWLLYTVIFVILLYLHHCICLVFVKTTCISFECSTNYFKTRVFIRCIENYLLVLSE